MKMDVVKKPVQVEQSTAKQFDNQETMTRRKQLRPLQAAAGDKENLVGAGRMAVKDQKTPKKPVLSVKVATAERKKQPALKTEKPLPEKTETETKVITVEDLTSEDGPSETYWEMLAKKRKVVLEKVLEENELLKRRLALLEEENEHCKQLLEESKTVITTLSEILQEETNDSD